MKSFSKDDLTPFQFGRLSIFNQNIDAYAAHSFAISQFSFLEFALLTIFIRLDDRENEDSVNAYWKIGSCRARFEWIEKRINNKQCEQDIFTKWMSIRGQLDNAIDVRIS